MFPVNSHLLIEPIKQKSFFGGSNYQEVGKVLDVAWEIEDKVEVGDTIWFDSWMAAKYPKPNAESDEDFYWLVKWSDVRGREEKSDV